MKALVLCLLGATGLPCMAAETFPETVNVGETSRGNRAGRSNTAAAWMHSIPAPAIGNITAASLTIDVTGVQNDDPFFSPADDHVFINLNSVHPGELTEPQTTFAENTVIITLSATNLTPFAKNQWQGLDEVLASVPEDEYADAMILTSTLLERYIPTVPTPGAILLACIGTTLVGFLRKRH